MPDLGLDTSIYRDFGKPQGQMGLGDLLGLATKANDFRTRTDMGDALRQNADPSQPSGVNIPQARGQYLRNAPFADPSDLTALTGADKSGSELQQWRALQAADYISSWVDDPRLSKKFLADKVPLLASYGVPPEMITKLMGNPQDGPGLRADLVGMRNWLSGAAGKSVGTVVPGTNQPVAVPESGAAYAQRGIGAGATPGMATAGAPGSDKPLTGSGDVFSEHLTKAANYRREVMPLENAIPALQELGKTGTGPGAEQLNQFKSFLQTVGAGDVLKIDPEKIKDFDKAQKYLVDWANTMSSGQTNDRLAATFSSNPNTHMSNAAAVDVAKTALSLRRMQQAQVQEFMRTHPAGSEGQYLRWASDWNKTQDPRAYGFDMLGTDQQKKLLASMKTPERAKFIASLQTAERHELTAPQAGWGMEKP